jgi:hypothetical protein
MQNQKDTLQNKKDSTLSDSTNTLNTNAFSEFIIKKTEKLVTALYMVTDCMDSDDAMKNKLRTLGVGLLSDAHSFALAGTTEKQYKLDHSGAQISEILSLVGIANMMGFVSEMNSSILKNEFNILLAEHNRFRSENSINKSVVNMPNTKTETSLDMNAFNVPLPTYKEAPQLPSQFWPTAIQSKGQTSFNKINVLYKNENMQNSKPLNSDKNVIVRKEERSQKMIDLIKSKGDVSIKDISFAFTDCSEKTIQRELNNLVSKGQLKKSGSKRWSRYSVN